MAGFCHYFLFFAFHYSTTIYTINKYILFNHIYEILTNVFVIYRS